MCDIGYVKFSKDLPQVPNNRRCNMVNAIVVESALSLAARDPTTGFEFRDAGYLSWDEYLSPKTSFQKTTRMMTVSKWRSCAIRTSGRLVRQLSRLDVERGRELEKTGKLNEAIFMEPGRLLEGRAGHLTWARPLLEPLLVVTWIPLGRRYGMTPTCTEVHQFNEGSRMAARQQGGK